MRIIPILQQKRPPLLSHTRTDPLTLIPLPPRRPGSSAKTWSTRKSAPQQRESRDRDPGQSEWQWWRIRAFWEMGTMKQRQKGLMCDETSKPKIKFGEMMRRWLFSPCCVCAVATALFAYSPVRTAWTSAMDGAEILVQNRFCGDLWHPWQLHQCPSTSFLPHM